MQYSERVWAADKEEEVRYGNVAQVVRLITLLGWYTDDSEELHEIVWGRQGWIRKDQCTVLPVPKYF